MAEINQIHDFAVKWCAKFCAQKSLYRTGSLMTI